MQFLKPNTLRRGGEWERAGNRPQKPMFEMGPGCVKTRSSGECAELSSLFSSFDGDCQSGSFVIQRNGDKLSTRKFDVGVFTQAGSDSDIAAFLRDVCSALKSGHRQAVPARPKSANTGHEP
jgi:hypothetical protein